MREPATMHYGRGPDRRKGCRSGLEDNRHGDRRRRGVHWITLFRDADPRQVDEALVNCEVLLLKAGTPLLRRGEANRDFFILLSGMLSAQVGDDASPETSIEFAPGDCIGELSAIDGKPITALVVAACDARVLRLDREVFWNRLMLLPGVAENLMRTLTERMRRANDKALAMQREQLELKHLRKELDVARQLQASMLPLQRPLFPGRSDIEACGFMEPASKVGGDLFDALFVDSRTLFLCIGDVSGHGIAAALFMVRVIGLLRTMAVDKVPPEKILEALNDRLCAGNETNLFVTLFCGYLDVQTGTFVYSNGGHCAPMVCNEREGSLLPVPKGMLVGVASGRQYSGMACSLGIGETLFCYTDGVTEAEDAAGVQFSVERCLDRLRLGASNALPNLLDSLHESVVRHCGSSLLADDCTMLAVRRTMADDRAHARRAALART